MPNLVDKDHCCGCAACINKCMQNAIKMDPDYTGFLYPIIDKSKCIECGLCEKSCPGLSPKRREEGPEPKSFVVQHNDNSIRYQSTSGGAFTAIASAVLKKNGVVFGAAMGDDFVVRHIFVDSVGDLEKFRNSKYVQSEIGDCYKKASVFLKQGIWVCFSGTPCQINGLLSFLGMDYPHLITVDVSCRSVPSPLVFQKYVSYKKKNNENANLVTFRDKKRGYSFCTLAWYSNIDKKKVGDSVYRNGSEADEWLRLFLKGFCNRLSCNDCHYQEMNRVSDFTLWDCWDITKVAPEWDDNKGTTNMVVWSEKGLALLKEMSDDIRYREYPLIHAKRGIVRNMIIKPVYDRDQFYYDANEMEDTAFFRKYVPINAKVLAYSMGRYIIWQLHLHNAIRKIKHMIIHSVNSHEIIHRSKC